MKKEVKKKKVKLTREQTLEKYGVKSIAVEVKITDQLNDAGIEYKYEPYRIKYIDPAKNRSYTPDWLLIKNNILIEGKGRFTQQDRHKHELIKEQHPELDIRFVFQNPNVKISKTSKTTYAMWCDSRGFKWAKGLIPGEWLK